MADYYPEDKSRGARFTRGLVGGVKKIYGAVTGKGTPSGGGSLASLNERPVPMAKGGVVTGPMTSIKKGEGSRSSGPAHGSYSHNSPAKPL